MFVLSFEENNFDCTNNFDNSVESSLHFVGIRRFESNQISPAQIRTGVKGSKGLYAWPLHSANLKFSTGLPDIFLWNF